MPAVPYPPPAFRFAVAIAGANDLDRLRSAGDFNAKSLPLLISALKQGTACFSQDEKRKVVESLGR